jgi:hypothetical protein
MRLSPATSVDNTTTADGKHLIMYNMEENKLLALVIRSNERNPGKRRQ